MCPQKKEQSRVNNFQDTEASYSVKFNSLVFCEISICVFQLF